MKTAAMSQLAIRQFPLGELFVASIYALEKGNPAFRWKQRGDGDHDLFLGRPQFDQLEETGLVGLVVTADLYKIAVPVFDSQVPDDALQNCFCDHADPVDLTPEPFHVFPVIINDSYSLFRKFNLHHMLLRFSACSDPTFFVSGLTRIKASGVWVYERLFIEKAHDQDFIRQLGIEGIDSLEGYLYPDTYRLMKPAGEEADLLKMLVVRSLSVWRDLSENAISDLNRHQTFTLASIVEKESGVDQERPVIASVFLNRLKKKMKLQSDPTVIYGLDSYDGKLTRANLRTPTPYNTYTIPALPPGPIASPGAQSLRAVLFPDDTKYLYFVSKNDGTHYFSVSLQEHNRAVRKYQRKGK